MKKYGLPLTSISLHGVFLRCATSKEIEEEERRDWGWGSECRSLRFMHGSECVCVCVWVSCYELDIHVGDFLHLL